MSTIENTFAPDYAIHPGEYLEEILEARHIPKAEFAMRCGLTPKTISQIVNQRANYSADVALQFERVLGVKAEIWTGMLTDYTLHESRLKEREALERAVDWASRFPLADLRKLGIIGRTKDGAMSVGQLLELFEVSSPDSWNAVYGRQAVAFRKSQKLEASEYAIATWLRLAEIAAAKVPTVPFDANTLRSILPDLRAISTQPTEVFQNEIVRLCSTAGVAVVVIPELQGARISGAAKWLTSDKALVALSLRHKTDDHFWFTLFHELGHLILHGKKAIFVDDNEAIDDEKECEANAFAHNALMPKKIYIQFVARGRYYPDDIREFAKAIGIAPGIVVGSLQHDGLIEYSWHNKLKQRLDFTASD